ncbi:MAG: GGDEF domain-containing protein, partial [Oscillospiraceae bacterium]
RVASLFRDGDILGRIGGDEFVVLMKNVYNVNLASTKAEEICSLLCENYIQRGRAYHISASVGVAMYPMHGKSYNDLFAHSDAALYYSKNNGRNRYSIYSNIMELVETGKEFNTGGLLEARTFEDNITEYIFRILYEATDKESAISAVLSLIGKFFNVSRTYIFENSPDGCLTSNTYEWCNDGIASCMDSLQNCNYDSAYPYVENFNIDDIFYLPDVSCATPYLQSLFLPTHAQSILQFAVRKTGKYVGFIGFDQCDTLRVPTRKQISDCHIIAQILGSFVIDIRLQKQNDIIAQGDDSKC